MRLICGKERHWSRGPEFVTFLNELFGISAGYITAVKNSSDPVLTSSINGFPPWLERRRRQTNKKVQERKTKKKEIN